MQFLTQIHVTTKFSTQMYSYTRQKICLADWGADLWVVALLTLPLRTDPVVATSFELYGKRKKVIVHLHS